MRVVGKEKEREVDQVRGVYRGVFPTVVLLPKTMIVPVLETPDQLPKEKLPFCMVLVVKEIVETFGCRSP